MSAAGGGAAPGVCVAAHLQWGNGMGWDGSGMGPGCRVLQGCSVLRGLWSEYSILKFTSVSPATLK